MKKAFVWMWALALMGTMACGGEFEESGASSQEETNQGGVHVIAQEVDASKVKKIVVFLEPKHHGGRDYMIELSQKKNKQWEGFEDHIYVGTYKATAKAYDSAKANPAKAKPIFTSHTVEVKIQKGKTAKVLLLLNEVTSPEKDKLPAFVAVVLSEDIVDQWETLDITVYAKGENRPLHLRGMAAPGEPKKYHGKFTPSKGRDIHFPKGKKVGSATLTWEPPEHEGPRKLILQIKDSKGNIVEMALWVQVGRNYGAAKFSADFNMAPQVSLITRVLNDENGTDVQIWLTAVDDRTSEVHYSWNHWSCGGRFLNDGGDRKGIFVPNDPSHPGAMYFHYFIKDKDRPEEGFCELMVTVTDYEEDEKGKLVPAASTVRVLEIDTDWLQP